MYDYSTYADEDNTQTNSGNNSGSSGSDDAMNLTMVPHAAIEGDLVKVFGNDNSFGQSLALVFENIQLVDGCLYYDAEKDKNKVFPWKDIVGMTPEEADDLTADDANKFLVKNYATTEKRYELVDAVVPEQDDPIEIGDAVMWYSGSEDHGPKAASRTLAKILTEQGRDMVIEEEDCTTDSYIQGWLADTSAENCLRSDLQDRTFAFFEVKKDSNSSNRQYHHPIVVDTQTGAQVTVANATDNTPNTENTESDDTPASEPTESDSGVQVQEVPAPVADFIETCGSIGFTNRERAATLLADLTADEGNPLTAEIVAEYGGEDAVLDEVAE